MNLKKIILSAALLGGVLSASAFATTAAAHAQVVTKAATFEAPVLARMVAPTGLSRRIEGTTVMLSLNINEHGQPSNIRVMSRDAQSCASLVAAVSKWQFTPAKKNGVAVPSKVVLPVELVESNS